MPGPQSIANGESNKVTVFHTSAKFCCGSQRVNILSFASQEEKLKILCKHLYNYLESNHLKTFKEINIRSLQAVGRQTANGVGPGSSAVFYHGPEGHAVGSSLHSQILDNFSKAISSYATSYSLWPFSCLLQKSKC